MPYRESTQPSSEAPATAHQGQQSALHIRELLGDQQAITIQHAGQDYTLRITRRGRLILTK